MLSSRSALRTTRALRVVKRQPQKSRFQSTDSSSTASNPALTGGIAGGLTALIGGYAWYHFSGAKTVVKTTKETQAYLKSAQEQFKKQIQEKAPSPSEGLKWLRQVSTYYAGFVPGASYYVNTAFDDLDKIHGKHGQEVDQII